MDEEHQRSTPMAERSAATKIIRKSIHAFMKNYLYFTFSSALFAVPYSISFLVLLSSPSSIFSSQFRTLFQAANFPTSSNFFTIVNLKLSQTISSSTLSLPFALTFLIISKASVFQCLSRRTSNYSPILRTYICTWFVLLSANATAFFLLFFSFNAFERIQVSQTSSSMFTTAFGVVIYSTVVANSMVVCELGLALSGVEGVGGSDAIIKAYLLIRGRTFTALSLALPLNLAFAATEAWFQLWISRSFHGVHSWSLIEGLFIGYLYSILIVLEAIITYVFYKSCSKVSNSEEEDSCRYHHTKIHIFDKPKDSMLLIKLSC